MAGSGWRLIVLPLVLVMAFFGAPLTAWANMAAPWMPGDRVGEPSGGLETVAIEHESLTIDLRPLVSDEPARVVATYAVRNDGPEKRLALEFVAAALAAHGTGVWLDGQPVKVSAGTAGRLPQSWQPPKSTPGLDGGAALAYPVRESGALFFQIALPAGRHTIRVRYLARATATSGDAPTRYWQLGYVLAPARQWASFGGLDVEVAVPTGWLVATSPTLTRSADVLTGTFASVPADSVAITTRAPDPTVIDPGPLILAGTPLALIVLGLAAGVLLGRLRRRSLWALPLSLTLGVVTIAAALIADAWSPTTYVPDAQVAWDYAYTSGRISPWFVLGASPILFVAGVALTQGSVFIGRRLATRKNAI